MELYEKTRGFTLAEVLITLGVIGIVAAMTIPTLINNYQKKQYATQMEKAYSIASQALQNLMVDNGCVGDLLCTGVLDKYSPQSTITFGSALSKYFKIVKNCEYSVDSTGCMPQKAYYTFDPKIKSSLGYTDLNISGYSGYKSYRFITVDGTSYGIYGAGTSTIAPSTTIYGTIDFDVNGPAKPPNEFGRDLFTFIITKNGTLSPISKGEEQRCNDGMSNGLYCAERLVKDGWQMNY